MINLKLGDMKEPLPERIVERLKEKIFENAHLYPMDYSKLVNKLAKMHGARPENIVLTAGTDDSIELLGRAFNKDILVFTPSYYEFVDAPKRNGFNYEAKNCFNGRGFDLKYSEEEVKDRSLIFLCNPNNPFGLLSKEEIVALAGNAGGIVAVDETYIDFAGETVIGEIEKHKNIVVMRSFSKSYSLAGMRIAYLAGDESVLEKIRKIKQICSVSSASVNAALAVLEEKPYFRELIARIMKGKAELEGFMEKKGFNIIHTDTNNILIKFPDEKGAGEFFNFLKEKGFLVNQGNGLATCGLDESFIRLNYGREEDMQKFREAVEGFTV